jgi:formimidoylglutamate deiminase
MSRPAQPGALDAAADEAASPRLLWAPAAWIGGRWREDVLLEVGADGHWLRVSPGEVPPATAERLAGPALPGLVDAHSHAFQRAFAGLTERREGADDDFWSWRDRMYRVANAVTPDSLRAIAAHLYLELLRGGYTQVCEFHYLRHAPGGTPYEDPLALSMALADAAADAGIGLTLLPTLYERAGFTAPGLRPDQQRFRAGADDIWMLSRDFARRAAGREHGVQWPPLAAGLAIHSVRAAAAESIARLRTLAEGFDGPIHIHIAEQRAELRDCVAATGATPIAWLAAQGWLDARWHLVHATHASPAEIAAVGASGAAVVLCPSTEGNLGDGLTDVPAWLAAGVDLAIGSDSQATRAWREELRWLEYGQRLKAERRNVCAQPGRARGPQPDTAAVLFETALAGGGRAAGHARWGFEPGARADLLVADPADATLAGLPHARWLDALVFSSPSLPWRDVLVAGRWALRHHHHPRAEAIAADFARAMATIL